VGGPRRGREARGVELGEHKRAPRHVQLGFSRHGHRICEA
jgi:hypothetical protein